MQNLQQLFESTFDPGARLGTAPLVALAVGILLYLVVAITPALERARPLVFLGTLAASFAGQLRILGAAPAPGRILEGTFQADPYTALWGMLFLVATLLAWVYSVGYFRDDLPFKAEYDVLLLTAPAGMMLMVGALDLIVFFIGLELLSIPLYALAAFRRSRIESVEAGLKYFLLGSFSSALFLYGASLAYFGSGSLALADLGASPERLEVLGIALIASSLFFKASIFPFHLWAPDVYQGAPAPVTGFMATGVKAAAFSFLVVRMTPFLPSGASATVLGIALLTLALGNLGALAQTDVKRMLAYSGVAHAGTLLLVVASGILQNETAGAQEAALYYMGAYLFTATGAFGLLGLLESDTGARTSLDSLRGLGRTRPGIAAALSLFMLSLGGIPATGGFLGKWFVFRELVVADRIGTAIVAALLSVVALAYYLRVIVVLWMHAPAEERPRFAVVRGWSVALATLACAAGVLAMGLYPQPFLTVLS